MLAVATVLRARPDLKSARPCRVGVAAARTKAAVVMDSQLDLAQRAFRLDNRGDRALSLGS